LALWIRSASRQLMREINESVVLGLIRQNGPISRVAIARTSHLSAATVTGITTRLIAQGLVSEKSQGASTGGRRPILLSFNSRAGIAIGFKITERELVCVATDLSAEQEQHSRITLPDHATPEDVIALIASEVDRAQGAATSRRLVGVGVGIAGVVDRPSGVCRLSPFLRWTDVPLRAALEDAVSVPVVVENDVNTLTFAVRGEVISTDRNSFIVVTVGRGIGLGMMLNGMPFRGARGQGGEFGHITVDPSGPTCECGKQGCLEAIASMPALIRDASSVIGRPITEPELRELILSEDRRLAPLADHAAKVLGEALATLVNILNPGKVVLSGEGAWLLNHTLRRIVHAMNSNVFDGLSDELEVRVEERGDEFWAAGAAGLLLDDVFHPRLQRA